jgi:hypothetical protein
MNEIGILENSGLVRELGLQLKLSHLFSTVILYMHYISSSVRQALNLELNRYI